MTDRTPVDLLAYTVAEAVGQTVPDALQERHADYVRRCIELTNARFTTLVVVQPGIPLVPEAGKAVCNEAYIEHLNVLVRGFMADERLRTPNFYIGRSVTDMDERVNSVLYAVRITNERHTQALFDRLGQGIRTH